MNTDVDMNCWVEIDEAEIKYVVSRTEKMVEFTIGNEGGLTINMTERALAQCVEQFPVALSELRELIASTQ
ncbi:hypothetical protein ALI144C_34925 [Actinosynnema sp. ALI-1.44]|uniref:hypothetical protein n=1 Tax=Actinosynnema sp. ALI-1.44 TaxID=1933779 RepID=UPI00097C7F70|nr:hypothetical protein [Actinosynnema sp. ALI-1.44]ONI77259.1 hypothetical protein ALI144C_34925 [Actinosynnema sp. ALI-1.44]